MTALSERAQAALAARHEREAAALRANLRRRKAKARLPEEVAVPFPATATPIPKQDGRED